MFRRLESITYALFLFLTPLLVTSFSKEVFEFPKIIFLYFITGILLLLIAKNFDFEFLKTSKVFYVILIATFISFVISIDHYTSLFGYYTRFNGGFASIICLTIWVLYILWKNLDKEEIEKSLLIIFFGGLCVAVYALIQKAGIDKNFWAEDSTKRVFSTLGQPNWLAAYLVPIFYLSIYFCNKWKVNIFVKYLPVLAVYFAIIFTYSISGILAFAISFIIFLALHFQMVKIYFKRFWHIFLIVLALSSFAAIPLKDRIIEQQKNMSNIFLLLESGNSNNLSPEYGDSGKIRLILWDGTLKLITSSPKQFLFGSGPETFVYAFTKFRPDSINATSEADFVHNKPHNWFLEIFANLGLLGFCAYLFFIITNIRLFLKSEKTNLQIAIFCGWISILVSNFFGWPTVALSVLFFVLPVFMNYRFFAKKQIETPHEINFLSLFSVGVIANILILAAIILALADYNYKEQNYFEAHTLNPFETRYAMFDLIYNQASTEEDYKNFYYENRQNPFVVKTLVNYFNSSEVLGANTKREIVEDAAKNSPSDREFIFEPQHK